MRNKCLEFIVLQCLEKIETTDNGKRLITNGELTIEYTTINGPGN